MPSAMLLYNAPVSGNCYKVRLLAAQLGLPLELIDLDVIDTGRCRYAPAVTAPAPATH